MIHTRLHPHSTRKYCSFAFYLPFKTHVRVPSMPPPPIESVDGQTLRHWLFFFFSLFIRAENETIGGETYLSHLYPAKRTYKSSLPCLFAYGFVIFSMLLCSCYVLLYMHLFLSVFFGGFIQFYGCGTICQKIYH